MAESASQADALVRSAAEGDRASFETLVRTHAGAVYAHAHRFFGDAPTAEDASQEVWIKVYRSLRDFGGRAAFSTWLFSITRNVCLDMMRRGCRVAAPIDPVDLAGRAGDDTAGEAVAALDLESALRALAPEDREALGAITLFGLSYADAGSALGVPAGTIKSRVFRARRTLITALGLDSRGGV